MSLKTTRRMPGFEGVSRSNTATCRLPIGLSYHQILLDHSGLLTAAVLDLTLITEIRVVANGEVIQRLSGDELEEYNTYEGRSAQSGTSGTIIIDLDRYNMRTREAEEFTKLGTGLPAPRDPANPQPGEDPLKITTLALEIDLAEGDGAYTPSFSARAVQSTPAPSGLMKKIRKFTYNPGGAVDFEISDLPKGDPINKILFFTAATRLRVERDNFMVFDRTKGQNDRVQTDGVRVPSAGLFVYDPTENGNGAESLVTAGVNDLRFTLTVPGAEVMTILMETIAPLQV